jgi:hypothetical protein
MISAVAGDELPAARIPVLLVVLASDLEGDLVGLRAGVGVEEDVVAIQPLVELLA